MCKTFVFAACCGMAVMTASAVTLVSVGDGETLTLAAHPHRNPTVHVMPAIRKACASAQPGECGVGSANDLADWRRLVPAFAADGVEWLVVKPTVHVGSLADLAASIKYLKKLLARCAH